MTIPNANRFLLAVSLHGIFNQFQIKANIHGPTLPSVGVQDTASPRLIRTSVHLFFCLQKHGYEYINFIERNIFLSANTQYKKHIPKQIHPSRLAKKKTTGKHINMIVE
jgi:hypothetical protein